MEVNSQWSSYEFLELDYSLVGIAVAQIQRTNDLLLFHRITFSHIFFPAIVFFRTFFLASILTMLLHPCCLNIKQILYYLITVDSSLCKTHEKDFFFI